MKKLRVLVLMHEDLIPPQTIEGLSDKEVAPFKAEYDVVTALEELGHEPRCLGVQYDLGPIRRSIISWKPDVAFNLLEEFHSVPLYDYSVVSYLELMRQPYTGCNPRGLMLAHDKALSKKILSYHRIPTPRFAVFPLGRRVKRPKRLQFPLLVKSLTDHASLGIAQASIVHDDDMLVERVALVHNRQETDAIVEEYIEGRELYVGIIGNHRLQTLPVWEMLFTKMPEDVPRIATAKVKWDLDYQKKNGITTCAAKNLPNGIEERIVKLCKRIYRVLNLSGYARMDLRLAEDGRIYVLEANPNPNLEFGEDFSESAEVLGTSYNQLIQRFLNLGMRYHAPWKA